MAKSKTAPKAEVPLTPPDDTPADLVTASSVASEPAQETRLADRVPTNLVALRPLAAKLGIAGVDDSDLHRIVVGMIAQREAAEG